MKNTTSISIVLDRSGSMSSIKSSTIEGYNSFLEKQREVPGEAIISLHQFDDKYETLYTDQNIKTAPFLTNETFVPRGSTALIGALGKTVDELGARLAKLPESERPNKILICCITDGGENHSHYEEWSKLYTPEKIATMVDEQKKKYNWEFVFIGANQDAILTGKGMNIGASSSYTYQATNVGTTLAFAALSTGMACYRSAVNASFSFKDEDRQDNNVVININQK